jgi:MFS superfamily sulfate permease-like transporter
MAGGRSQLVNVFMAILIGVVLIAATGLFAFVPVACLAAVVFSIGLHLLKIKELKKIWRMRKSEFAIAMVALACVAALGVQQGVMIAVLLSLIERLRRQYHPHDEVLLRDQEYAEWAAQRLHAGKQPLEAPAGLLIYRFNDAIFFENTTYFLKRATKIIKSTKNPVKNFILDASAISDIDYTAAQSLERLAGQLNADDIQFGIAHVSPRLRYLLKRYGLTDLIGIKNIFPSVRVAIAAYTKSTITNSDRIRSLRLSRKSYVVIGGAVLEFLGIRETNDVDLVVDKKTYDRLKANNWKEYVHDDGKKTLSRSGYIIMQHWMGKSLSDLQKNYFVVN